MIRIYLCIAIAAALAVGTWAIDRNGYRRALRDADAAIEQTKAAAAEWSAAIAAARADLDACQSQWADVSRRADQAEAAAAAARDAAERQRAQWQARWDARPTGCAAALDALDAACPALAGY